MIQGVIADSLLVRTIVSGGLVSARPFFEVSMKKAAIWDVPPTRQRVPFHQALDSQAEAGVGHQFRIEAEEVNHKTQASFILFSGPELRTNRERIAITTDTSPDPGVIDPEGSEYFHAYVSRRSGNRAAKSTDVHSEAGPDFQLVTSWNWNKQPLTRSASKRIRKIIGPLLQVAGTEIPNCLTQDRKSKVTGSVIVELNETGIRRALPGFRCGSSWKQRRHRAQKLANALKI